LALVVKTYVFKSQVSAEVAILKEQGKSIGLVPTMGALHSGHASLVKRCAEENDVVVVTVFVNPTQFNDSEDLLKYPRDLENDQLLLKGLVSKQLILFAPDVGEMYATEVVSERFDFGGLDRVMEGKYRPGHFDGVATIVTKLFEIVQPDNAYFGEKDFQQLLIIQKVVKQLQTPVNIVPCEIYREEDGLAMSSRNQRLTAEQRSVAPQIYRALKTAKSHFGTESVEKIEHWVQGEFEKQPLMRLEYFTISEEDTLRPVKYKETNKKYRAFISVYAGEVRSAPVHFTR
jgi:pantoate--beta-alanine ligase